MPESRRSGPAVDFTLLGILLMALVLRIWSLDTPLVDAHSWRQVTNADIARHFAEGSLDLFHPRVSWGGQDGVVGMEFPLLQWMTGVLWRATRESSVVARLVAVAFSLAGVVCMYGLGRRLMGHHAALASAFLMAASPSVVFFGRSFLSDTPMLMFMLAAVWAWDVYFARPRWSAAVVAGVLTALAALVKLPAILVLAPIVGVAWRHQRWRALGDGRAWVAATGAVLLTAAWYWHADRIFVETGLTQAVFRPSGTYPSSVAPGVQFTSVSHWATFERLTNPEVWREFSDRFWQLHLTGIGALGALLGVFLVGRFTSRIVVDLWALGGLALFLVAIEGQYWHEFHQLPVLPPLMLYFGAAAAPLFDGAVWRRVWPSTLAAPVLWVVASVAVLQGMRSSGAERHLYRPDNLQDRVIRVGEAIRSATASGALIATVEYEEAGANSPMLLYFARRQGWSFDVRSITSGEVEWLRTRMGVRYLATTHWHALAARKPDVAALVEARYKEVPLGDIESNARLFDLTQPR